MDTILLDNVGDAPTRHLANGAIVAMLPGAGASLIAHRIVCGDLVPLAQDPTMAPTGTEADEHLGEILAEAGPGATGRCRAPITRLDDNGWGCARGHGYSGSLAQNLAAEYVRERVEAKPGFDPYAYDLDRQIEAWEDRQGERIEAHWQREGVY